MNAERRFYLALAMGEVLRTLRIKNDLQQRDIAELLGICVSSYSRIESGKMGLSLEDAEFLCSLYSMPLEWVLDQRTRLADRLEKAAKKPMSEAEEILARTNRPQRVSRKAVQ